jgi:transposase
MPCPLPLAIRHQIVQQYSKGHSLIAISEDNHLSYSTVCNICNRYKEQGAKGLQPRYEHCGRPRSSTTLIQRASLWLKRLHPGWGATLIRTVLKMRYRRASLPCERTLQRWFHAAGLYKAKTTFPLPATPWARRVHDIWQVDAKEKLHLSSGQKACYLTMVDEKSGCLLKAVVFPPLSY